jgi:ribosome biogenesis GTPase A
LSSAALHDCTRLDTGRRAVVLNIVDLVDFESSVLCDVERLIGVEVPLILVLNKFDLMPDGATLTSVMRWVQQRTRELRLRSHDVHIVCSRTGHGIPFLMERVEEIASNAMCDIYVIGTCNAGKSTFINKLLQLRTIKGVGRGFRPRVVRTKDGEVKTVNHPVPVTASVVPGTTLDPLRSIKSNCTIRPASIRASSYIGTLLPTKSTRCVAIAKPSRP